MFAHLSAGRVGIRAPAGSYNGSVQQRMSRGALSHALTSAALDIVAETVVSEGNVILTTLSCQPKAGGAATCPLVLSLSDTNSNHFAVEQATGTAAAGTLIWWRKENLHEALNPAYLGTCDPLTVLQSTQRAFVAGARTGEVHFVWWFSRFLPV